VALLGDAACQVYTAHGSGIGIGLIAASLLANTALTAREQRKDIGALPSLWAYTARFHQRWMPLLGAADVMRRFSQRQGAKGVERMLGQLITPSMARDALAQQPTRLHREELPGLIKAALRDPASALKLLPVLARLPLLELVAQTYPEQDSSHAQVDLYRYEQRLRWLVDSV
jgi:flavin-dependent dehydrogenase